MSSPATRDEFLKIAREWLQMAMEVERISKLRDCHIFHSGSDSSYARTIVAFFRVPCPIRIFAKQQFRCLAGTNFPNSRFSEAGRALTWNGARAYGQHGCQRSAHRGWAGTGAPCTEESRTDR
jgi:hypothetical protein